MYMLESHNSKRYKMNSFFMIFGFYFLIIASAYPQVPLDKVMIIDFDEIGTGNLHLAQALTENLRVEIINSQQFSVVERNLLDEIMREQGLGLTGLIDPETAVEVGKLVGANIIIAGSLTKIGSIFTLNYRIINIETGLIDKAGSLSCDDISELPELAYNLSQMISKQAILKSFKQIKVTESSGYNAMSSVDWRENIFYVTYVSDEIGNDNIILLCYDNDFNLLDKIFITSSSKWNSRYPKITISDSLIYIFYSSVENINTVPKVEKYHVAVLDFDLKMKGTYMTEVHPASIKYYRGRFYCSYMSTEGSMYSEGVRTYMVRNTRVGILNLTYKLLNSANASFLNFHACYSVYSDVQIVDDRVYVAFESNEQKASVDIFISVFDLELNFIEKARITTLEPSWEDYPSLDYYNGMFFLAYNSNEKGNKDIFMKVLDKNFREITKIQLTSTDYSEICPAIIYNNEIIYIYYDLAKKPYAYQGDRNIYVELMKFSR